MAYWLFKSEPGTWSWEDQVKAGKKGTEWDGVKNYQARNFMREMKKELNEPYVIKGESRDPGATGKWTHLFGDVISSRPRSSCKFSSRSVNCSGRSLISCRYIR